MTDFTCGSSAPVAMIDLLPIPAPPPSSPFEIRRDGLHLMLERARSRSPAATCCSRALGY
jgi:hypothetical protein